MKVITVVGARPQFIKAAVVSRAFAAEGAIEEMLVHTGQHFDHNMSDVFFDELDIPPPRHHLGIGGGRHGQNTGRMIEAIETVLLDETPDWVLVYGDTDSTLATAVAAAKLSVPIIHVEAGLRSFNRAMPEEINRILTDHASTLLFAPSQAGMDNLAREGIAAGSCHLVGDVMYDAAISFSPKAQSRAGALLDGLRLMPGGYVLCTTHRKENVDDPARLRGIVEGVAASERIAVLPLHPRTRARLAEFDIALPSNVHVIDPVGYLEMIALERNAAVVATDSGGVQKEAFFHRVPCVTLREETEWVELIDAGVNRLVGTDPARIAEAIATPVDAAAFSIDLYGGGTAAQRIVDILSAGMRDGE
jgi:UDP-GlcNAc3NAcA epimerase